MYDSYKLMAVQYGTHQLAYTYDAYGKLTGITIDGTSYSCELENGSVRKLIDGDGNTAVEYIYDGSRVVAVYGRDEFGNLVDKTNDSEFIGNLNRVTYNSYYYDVETGWYYCGRYYDAENGRFVDGIDASVDEILERVGSLKVNYPLVVRVMELYNLLLNDAEFGCAKNVGTDPTGWYDNLETVEILARLIYGENPYYNTPQSERRAVAWVLWNRKMKGYYDGGTTLRGIATQPRQFSPIWDASSYSTAPIVNSAEWRQSVLCACYLYYAETAEDISDRTATLELEMPRPWGITENHVNFCNYPLALTYLNSGTVLPDAVIAGYEEIGTTAQMLTSTYGRRKLHRCMV